MQKSDDAIDVFCENGLFNSANPSTTGKKLVTEYQNLYSSWEILRHFIFSIKQFLQRYYLEFEILRFTSSLFHTELWGQTCHLPPLAVPRLVLPGEGTDHDMVSQHLKEPEFPDLTWNFPWSEWPSSSCAALQINTDPKEPFLSFPFRLPYISLLKRSSLPSVLLLLHWSSANP